MDGLSYRLPDLPNAGYSTKRQRELSDAIMVFMRNVERDRLALLLIVYEGLPKWRRVARKQFGRLLSHETVDEMYQVLSAWAGENVLGQIEALVRQAQMSPVQRMGLR